VCPVRAGRGSDARPVCTGRSGDVRPVCTGIVSCSNVTKRFRMLSGLSSARPEVLPRSSSRACITGSEHSKKSTKQTSTSSLSTAVQPWKMITWLIQEYPTIQLFPPRDAGARTMEATVRSRGSGPFREATRPLTEAAVRSGRHLRGELLLERREEPLELLRGEHPGRLARGEQRVHDLQEGRVRKLKVLRTRRVRLVRGEGRGVSD